MLKEYVEVMKSSLQKMEAKTNKVVDYDLEAKVQVFANLGMFYG